MGKGRQYTSRTAISGSIHLQRRALILIFLAFLSTGTHAQILECIDAQGRKEFASTCPPGTVSQKERRPKGDTSTTPAPQPDWQEQERAFQQRRLQRDAAEADAAKKQHQEQLAQGRCASARRAMDPKPSVALLKSGLSTHR